MLIGQGQRVRQQEVSRPSPGRCILVRLQRQLAPPPAALILPWLCLGRQAVGTSLCLASQPPACRPLGGLVSKLRCLTQPVPLPLAEEPGKVTPQRPQAALAPPRLQGQWTGGVAVWRQAGPVRPDAISPSLERRGRPGVSAEISPEVPSHDLCAHPTPRATMPAGVNCHFPLSPTSP